MYQKKTFLLLTKSGWKTVRVVFADFPKHEPQSHEQEGERPAVVIGFSNYHYSMFRLVPFTALFDIKNQRERVLSKNFPEVFPVFSKGVAGLERDSILLPNQARWLSSGRIIDRYGSLDAKQYAVVVAALRAANRGSS
jgi:mRNA-degrading endonuclease toxin of MazEF toxin-antitoxin module